MSKSHSRPSDKKHQAYVGMLTRCARAHTRDGNRKEAKRVLKYRDLAIAQRG